MGFLKQYMGLRKELYIIFWGRVVTNMGALIWPMMTLILKNKLGYSASQVAGIMMILGFVQLPCTLIGGKLADRFSKRNIIIVCDLVTVVSYFICGFLPIDRKMIPLLAIAALFAQMEWPSYDALVADLSSVNDRERAYSLNYLGLNLGLVLAPILGGFLFAEHLNLAFLIRSIATFSSTILIFFFIKDITPVQEESVSSQYEQAKSDQSIWKILSKNPLLYLFLFCGGLWSLVYSQFNFLLPLNLEQIYAEQGAVLLVFYFVAMVIFTLGEIVQTIGQQPYLTRRIPASHRGRFSSFYTIFAGAFQLSGQQVVGQMADTLPMSRVWFCILCVGAVNLFAYVLLRKGDEKAYPLLYTRK